MNISYFTESGVNLKIKTDSFFRFANCEAYNHLKGYGIKEMDLVVVNRNKLNLIELKQLYSINNNLFTSRDPENGSTIHDYTMVFKQKIIHSLSMLATNRAKTQNCANVDGFDFENNKIAVFFILNLDGKQKDLKPFQQYLDLNLKDIKALFKIDSIRIISDSMIEQFLTDSLIA